MELISQAVEVEQPAKVCGEWSTDGKTDSRYCCTPSVGRRNGKVKVAACVKIERPHDPWANTTGGPGTGIVPG